MTSDTSFWLKFLHEIDLSIDNNTLLRYHRILSNRFTTIEEFLSVDENELIQLGITNQFDRICLIKQARLLDDNENLPLIRQSSTSEHWHNRNQSTPLNPKSKCNLSPALLSRISFNDHSTSDELINLNKKSQFQDIIETPEKNSSCQKKTPPTSVHGMRTLKSISDTISLQKKIVAGNDRLKRLTLTKSLFKRQTALITKKVSNITNKIFNPFSKSNKFNNLKLENENFKNQIQVITINNDIQFSQQNLEEFKPIVQPLQTISNKRFKLGVPTTFVTRSLANLSQNE